MHPHGIRMWERLRPPTHVGSNLGRRGWSFLEDGRSRRYDMAPIEAHSVS
jgi:hypothetical protein